VQKPKRLMLDPDNDQYVKMPKVTKALLRNNIHNGEALYNLGTFEIQQANYPDALACLKLSWADRKTPETLLNLSTAHRFLGNQLECVKLLEDCIKRWPEFPLAYNNLGLVRYDQNKYTEAKELYRKAIELKYDYPDAHWNLGLALGLDFFSIPSVGNLGSVLEEYKWRFKKTSPVTVGKTLGTFEWDGSPLNGRKLMIMCEQGLGDMIQYLRYIHCFSPDEIVLHFPEETHILVDPKYTVCNVSTVPHDVWIPMCDLPKFVGLGNGSAYLTKLRHSELESNVYLGEGRNIGIVWKGSSKHANDKNRSMHFRDFFWLFKYGRVWSLQKDEKLPKYATDINIVNLKSWADTYNVIKALDLVVTVDTSVAHLAGAMGKRVLVLIPEHGIDWRWGRDNEKSIWYDSMTLVRKRDMVRCEEIVNEIFNNPVVPSTSAA